MRVKDIMSKTVITVAPTATITSAISLLIGARVSGLPVVDETGTLVGVLSESDLLRRAEVGTQRRRPRWLEWLVEPGHLAAEYSRAHGRLVGDVMTTEPVTIAEDASLEEAVAAMEHHSVKRLPVTHEGKLVGILTRADVIRGLVGYVGPAYEEQATSDAEIRRRLLTELASQPWAPKAAVEVEVENGVVHLYGAVFDDRERGALRVAAENIPGVQRVEDHLALVDAITGLRISAPDEDGKSRTA